MRRPTSALQKNLISILAVVVPTVWSCPFSQAFIIKRKEGIIMMVMAVFHPMLSLIAGVLILLMPRLLNYIVAIYLIVIGVSGLIR
jgi:hypothetical protein